MRHRAAMILSMSGLVVSILATTTARGQTPPQTQVTRRPAFEVASVKPVDPAAREVLSVNILPGGRVTLTSVTLKLLIIMAYGVQDVEIFGGPDWLNRARFNIVATGDPKPDEFPLMLQSLLDDRFKLGIHREKTELSVYVLRSAKLGGPHGPNLHAAEAGDCPQEAPATPEQVRSGSWVPCGAFVSLRGHLAGKKVTLQNLTSPLATQLESPVLDETDVPGRFDLTLDYTPDRGAPRNSTRPATLNDGGSIFTALQEQLGLKLESGKRSVETLVIDHAEPPTGN
jgi:uncharacterized protein (TIGR03435 family)